MVMAVHRIDDTTVREYEFRSTSGDACPVIMRQGERNNHPSSGNGYAVQFEFSCAMGAKPHPVHVFAVLVPGADEGFMVLWGAADEVFRIKEELHESNAEEARLRD